MKCDIQMTGLEINKSFAQLFCFYIPFMYLVVIVVPTLDIFFSSNHNIHKSSCGLCFWASDPLIDGFQKNLSIKGSEAQKPRPHELL